MVELEKLHKYNLSMLTLLSIACESLHGLVLLYLKLYFPNYDENDSKERSFSKFIQWLRTNHEGIFKTLNVIKFPQFIGTVFTDDSKQNLNAEIYFRKFDITAIGDILQNTPIFPSCKTRHRKIPKCKSKNHNGKCCSTCVGKHLCSSCGKSKCKVAKCCLSLSNCYQHPCSSCSAKSSECYDKSTVCCKNCGICFYCMGNNLIQCDNREIREIIDAIIQLRNLVAHSNDSLWDKLDNGTFSAAAFPNCQNWDDLSKNVLAKISKQLNYLETKGVISNEECGNKIYDLNKILLANKGELLKNFSHELLIEYARIMIDRSAKKSFYLAFEVELLNKKIPRGSLQLGGEVMTDIREVIKQTILHETSVSDGSIKVLKEKCELIRPTDLQTLKVIFKVKPKDSNTEGNLTKYEDPDSEVSQELWEILSSRIKDELLTHLGIEVDLWQEQWKIGSIIVQVALLKRNKTIWTVEEIEFLQSRKNLFGEDFNENVEIDIFSREEKIEHLKMKFGFRVDGVNFISKESFELIKNSSIDIVHKNTGPNYDTNYLNKSTEEFFLEKETNRFDIEVIMEEPKTITDKGSEQSDQLKSVMNGASLSEQASNDRKQCVYAAVSGQCGGYDEKFLDDVPEDLICGICKLVLRDPQQLECGHLLCCTCLEALKNSSRTKLECPYDRAEINPNKIFTDIKENRRILDLRVTCKKECHWTGELRYLQKHHLTCTDKVTNSKIAVANHPSLKNNDATPTTSNELTETYGAPSHGRNEEEEKIWKNMYERQVNTSAADTKIELRRRELERNLERRVNYALLCQGFFWTYYCFNAMYWSYLAYFKTKECNNIWIVTCVFGTSVSLALFALISLVTLIKKYSAYHRMISSRIARVARVASMVAVIFIVLWMIMGSIILFPLYPSKNNKCRINIFSILLMIGWISIPFSMNCVGDVISSRFSLMKYDCIFEMFYRKPYELDLEATLEKYKKEINAEIFGYDNESEVETDLLINNS